MSVITMNNPSSLRVKLDAGLNDSTGNTIVKSKTYSNLKYDANIVGKVLKKYGYIPMKKRINGIVTQVIKLQYKYYCCNLN